MRHFEKVAVIVSFVLTACSSSNLASDAIIKFAKYDLARKNLDSTTIVDADINPHLVENSYGGKWVLDSVSFDVMRTGSKEFGSDTFPTATVKVKANWSNEAELKKDETCIIVDAIYDKGKDEIRNIHTNKC